MDYFKKSPSYRAFRLLQLAFIVAPILAGADKFFNFMAYWPDYLAPLASRIIQNHDQGFMMVVGVIEIIAGIGVIFRPKIFSYIIAVWLFGIIVNLLLTGEYFDIALRDIGLMLAAVSLGILSPKQ